jgi:hypothetical protein
MEDVKTVESTGVSTIAAAIAQAKQAAAMVAPSVATGKVSRAARKRAFRASMRDSQRRISHALNAKGVYVNGAVVRSGRNGSYGSVFFSDYDATKKTKKATATATK